MLMMLTKLFMNLRTFRIGGVHPEENKITAEMATQVAPLPKQAIFPCLYFSF